MQLAPVATMKSAQLCTMAVDTMLNTRSDVTSNTSDLYFATSRTYLDTYTLYASLYASTIQNANHRCVM